MATLIHNATSSTLRPGAAARPAGPVVWNPPAVYRYGIALLGIVAAVGVRMAVNPILGPNAPYLPFVLALVLIARYAGRGPALAATVLSILNVAWFFAPPIYSFNVADHAARAGLGLFAVVGILVSLFVGSQRESFLALAGTEAVLRKYRQMVDLSHDAVITADANRVITSWNLGATEMYGWTEDQAIGKVIHELLKTTNHRPIPEIDAIVRREGRWEGELVHTTRDA